MQNAILPHNLKLEYSAAAIAAAVQKIGREISAWAQDVKAMSGEDLLTVPVLRGAIFFYADLMRQIDHSVQIAPARTWAYESDQSMKSEVAFHFDQVPVKGRSVLIVDDVCDSGRTLKLLCEEVLKAGAREVKTAALIMRLIDNPIFNPDWVGLKYRGKEWFVGYGMDDKEKWRNLENIYVILKD